MSASAGAQTFQSAATQPLLAAENGLISKQSGIAADKNVRAPEATPQ